MADWSQLPQDLIGIIANRLGSIEDFLSFSSVCSSWRSAVPKEQWNSCVPRLPWLLLLKSSDRFLFSMDRKKLYHVDNPLLKNENNASTTTNGWIFISEGCSPQLIDPLTGFQIRLPLLSSTDTVAKVVVSQRPMISESGNTTNNNDNNIIIAISVISFGRSYQLRFARPGLKQWIILQDDNLDIIKFYFLDVVCYKGRIYAAHYNGRVVLCGIDWSPEAIDIDNTPPCLEHGRCLCSFYLVESNGDLLLALEYSEKIDTTAGSSFEVYKFNPVGNGDGRGGGGGWTKLEDLGGCTLFLSNRCSISIPPTDQLDCRANSIYYITPNCRFKMNCSVNVFDMKDKTTEHYSFTNLSHLAGSWCLAWVMPTFGIRLSNMPS